MFYCDLCNRGMFPADTGEPWLPFKGKAICYDCYVDLIPEIYKMAGYGDGGIIQLIFSFLLKSSHNRKRRVSIKNYKKIFNKLLERYKFKCVNCESMENLTIDHIQPVSRGGSDDFSNLQILCKPCNSSKGARWEI